MASCIIERASEQEIPSPPSNLASGAQRNEYKGRVREKRERENKKTSTQRDKRRRKRDRRTGYKIIDELYHRQYRIRGWISSCSLRAQEQQQVKYIKLSRASLGDDVQFPQDDKRQDECLRCWRKNRRRHCHRSASGCETNS